MTELIVFYATDTMADWEYGYLLAGLALANQETPGRFGVVVAAENPDRTVTSMGGLRVLPDQALADIEPAGIAALVLPGAATWSDGHESALTLAGRVLTAGGVVAGICGATYGLARAGLLDGRDHTSNAAEFVAAAPNYRGADRYSDAKTVSDGGLITAPATAPVDFARAVFEALEVFPSPVLDAWYGLYTTGERRFYDALVGA
ncbi:MAG: DJ-1/PfpI family protein [Microlunatus sp.]|nr:DJ-1/PfpI family protein [Microlunatus sp.]MDN5771461.1 DJ-1/PfpI family protein [Microlunatus sp.]